VCDVIEDSDGRLLVNPNTIRERGYEIILIVERERTLMASN